MKKFILLCVAMLSITACSSSDNEPTTTSDVLVGMWQLESNLEAGIERSTTCTRQSTITFLVNGNTSGIEFEEEFVNNNTVCVSFTTPTMTWENLGNSNYKLGSSSTAAQTRKFTFSENNSKFSLILKEGIVNGQNVQEISTYKKI